MLSLLSKSVNPSVIAALAAYRERQAQRQPVSTAPRGRHKRRRHEIDDDDDDEENVQADFGSCREADLRGPIRLEKYTETEEDREFVADEDDSDEGTDDDSGSVDERNILPQGSRRVRRRATYMNMVPTPNDIRELLDPASSSGEEDEEEELDREAEIAAALEGLPEGMRVLMLRDPCTGRVVPMRVRTEDFLPDHPEDSDNDDPEEVFRAMRNGAEEDDVKCVVAGFTLHPVSSWATTLLSEEEPDEELSEYDAEYCPEADEESDEGDEGDEEYVE